MLTACSNKWIWQQRGADANAANAKTILQGYGLRMNVAQDNRHCSKYSRSLPACSRCQGCLGKSSDELLLSIPARNRRHSGWTRSLRLGTHFRLATTRRRERARAMAAPGPHKSFRRHIIRNTGSLGSLGPKRQTFSFEDEDITDLFASFPSCRGVPEELHPLTVRAVVIGVLLGSLVNASNVYLGKG